MIIEATPFYIYQEVYSFISYQFTTFTTTLYNFLLPFYYHYYNKSSWILLESEQMGNNRGGNRHGLGPLEFPSSGTQIILIFKALAPSKELRN